MEKVTAYCYLLTLSDRKLTVADEDIEEHWEAYKTDYLQGR